MNALPNFLKKENDKIIFIGDDKLEIYAPQSYLENESVVTTGNILKIFGVFCFKYKDKMYKFNLPVKVPIEYSDRRTEKNVSIKQGLPKDDYVVFILNKGDAFIADINHEMAFDDTDFFVDKVLYAGKFPKFLTYDEIYKTTMSLLTFAGGNYNTPSSSFEILVSELCRDKNNMSKSFRFSTSNMSHPYGYKLISIKKVPEKQSVFNSFIGEDFKHQVITSVLRTRMGEEDVESPVETLFKL